MAYEPLAFNVHVIVDLPKDCEEAYKNGYKTGEVMIWPTATVKPFFVYCDMELVPNHGMICKIYTPSLILCLIFYVTLIPFLNNLTCKQGINS